MKLPQPSQELITSNPELFTWLLAVTLTISVGALIYHIVKSDKNNEKQWAKMDNHETRISHLEGKCESNHK